MRQVSDTNKAQFRTLDGKVRKRYLCKGDAARDYALLQVVSESFREKVIAGWAYRSLRVYPESDYDELVMEVIDGENLDAMFATSGSPSIFRHAGRWLGVLHSERDNEGLVATFNDYNRSNIIVDSRKREVVALDPGKYDCMRSHPSVSLVVGAFSIIRGTFGRGIGQALKSVREFVSGYVEGIGHCEVPSLRYGRRYLIGRLVSGQSRTLGKGRAVRLVVGALEAFLVCGVVRMAYVSQPRTSER